MMATDWKHISLLAMCLLLMVSCKQKKDADSASQIGVDYKQVSIPQFEADSAVAYIEAQMAFGPRTPGAAAWKRCGDWIVRQMNHWCDTVYVQDFHTDLWDGTPATGCNIVGSLRPKAAQRVVLAAHWDSRLWADHDPDPSKHHSAVPGANDGASGAAMLMELARIMHTMPPSVGVDFVFFDLEDQGIPEWASTYEDNTWCKGSQYWAKHRHVPYYTAAYGILFDMVATFNPRYTQEEVSRTFAPGLTRRLWRAAASIGYGHIFISQPTAPILDDHLYVNQIADIPMVDIVQNSATESFFPHWHTTTDDLDHVSPQTLATVAHVVLATLYADYPHQP